MAVKEDPKVPPQPSVVVDLRVGEFLLYKVIALGSTPVFTLADDRGRTILTSQGKPPQMSYQRKWPKSPDDDPLERVNEHAIIGLMGLVTKYTYKVELHKSDGSIKETVVHSDFIREKPFDDADQCHRSLTVRLKM
jgi:hypothetical protein